MSVFGTPEERATFFEDVRANKFSDVEIVERIREAAARTPRFVPHLTPAAGQQFWNLAEKFFRPRIALRSLVCDAPDSYGREF